MFLLNRQWIWADLQRSRFRETKDEAPKLEYAADLAHENWASLFMWCALLWSVVEAFDERGIVLCGAMRADLDYVRDTLRRCRNVVFHVSSKDQHDARLYGLLLLPDSFRAISRVSTGLGRLFAEEWRDRAQQDPEGPSAAAQN